VKRMFALLALLVISYAPSLAQGVTIDDVGIFSGSLQSDVQSYTEDTTIGAPEVPERILSNTFVNVLFNRGKLTLGFRFESYQNPLLGIDPRFGTTGAGTGIGIPFRFVNYVDDYFEVTAGNFYEQFGSGMVMRTYEERNLGFDNSIDGLRLRFMPVQGMKITGFIGRQRAFFELSEGIMRGADLNLDLKEISETFLPDDVYANFGASVVSRYQADQNPFLNLPENVLAWSTRANITVADVMLEGEYAYKINDPSATNGGTYNPGNALYVNASYASSGLGISAAMKRIDNMDFRSDRTATGFAQQVNFLPALTKQHTWRLITLYPYATQPTGEFGAQADVTYTIPKGSFLGEDETTISLNASVIHALDTTRTDAFHYDANFMWDDRIFFQDINIEIVRKFGKNFKITSSYINIKYDQDVIEGRAAIDETKYGVLTADFAEVELWFKSGKGTALRTEFQWMGVSYQEGVERDAVNNGDWVMVLAEYSISPAWFFSLFSELNYNRTDPVQDPVTGDVTRVDAENIIYPSASVAYVKNALRVQVGYGRIRGGILCVGGICRPVPASNGLSMNVSYTF
jgi:hypothetical protein